MIRNFLSLIISTLLFFNTAYSEETRTVEESNKDVAWKVDGKFIKAECFDYIWNSGDRYETFYDEYFKKPSLVLTGYSSKRYCTPSIKYHTICANN